MVVLVVVVDDATDSDGLSGPLPWSWLRYPSADFCDPDLGSRMKSFGLGFGAFDSCDSDCVHPRRSKFFPNLVVMASADQMERTSACVHLLDLRVCGGTSSGFPLMYRPPKLRVAQRGHVGCVSTINLTNCRAPQVSRGRSFPWLPVKLI